MNKAERLKHGNAGEEMFYDECSILRSKDILKWLSRDIDQYGPDFGLFYKHVLQMIVELETWTFDAGSFEEHKELRCLASRKRELSRNPDITLFISQCIRGQYSFIIKANNVLKCKVELRTISGVETECFILDKNDVIYVNSGVKFVERFLVLQLKNLVKNKCFTF